MSLWVRVLGLSGPFRDGRHGRGRLGGRREGLVSDASVQ